VPAPKGSLQSEGTTRHKFTVAIISTEQKETTRHFTSESAVSQLSYIITRIMPLPIPVVALS